MEVVRVEHGEAATMEQREQREAADAGLFAGFKYRFTMFLTQLRWQQEREGERRRQLEEECEKKNLELAEKARLAEQLQDELDCEKTRADYERSRLHVTSERTSNGYQSEKECKLQEELSLLATTSKCQLEELRAHAHDLEERLMAKCGELSLACEQLQATKLQMSSCQNEASRLEEKLQLLESQLKEQEQHGKQLELKLRPVMSVDERIKERMKELTARCNRLMVEGFAKDKELAAAKEGLAKAAMDKIQHTSETASLKSTVTIMQTELYNARNALQAAEQELKSVNAAFAGSRAALEVECHKRNELEEQLGTLTRLQGNNSNMTGHQEPSPTAAVQEEERRAQDNHHQVMEKELQSWRERVEEQLRENIRLKEALDAASSRVSDLEKAEAASEASRRRRRNGSTQTLDRGRPSLFHQLTCTTDLVVHKETQKIFQSQSTATDDLAILRKLCDESTSTTELTVDLPPIKAPLFCASTSTKDLPQGPLPGLEAAPYKNKDEDPPAVNLAADADASVQQDRAIQERQHDGDDMQAGATLEPQPGAPSAETTNEAPLTLHAQEAMAASSPAISTNPSKKTAETSWMQGEHVARPSLANDEELTVKLATAQASPAPDSGDAAAAVEPPSGSPAGGAAHLPQEEHSLQLAQPTLEANQAPCAVAGSLEGVKLEQAFPRLPATAAEGDSQCAPDLAATGPAPRADELLCSPLQAEADVPLISQEEDSVNVTLDVKLPPQLDPDHLFEYYRSILESQGPGGPSQLFLGTDMKPSTKASNGAGDAQGAMQEGDTLALLAENVEQANLEPEERGGEMGQVFSENSAREEPCANPGKPSSQTIQLLDILPTQLLGISNAPNWSTDIGTAEAPGEAGADQSTMATSMPAEADPEAFLSLIKDSSSLPFVSKTPPASVNAKRSVSNSTASCIVCSKPAEGTMAACGNCHAGAHETCLEQLRAGTDGGDWCIACPEGQAKKRVKS